MEYDERESEFDLTDEDKEAADVKSWKFYVSP